MGSLPEQFVFRSRLPDIAIPDHLPLHDYVFERLADRRDRACLIDGATGETLSFGDVDALSRRVAAGLSSIGVCHGSTVMLLLPNSVEFAVAFLASSRLGAVTTTANPLHTPPEIAKQVAASGATVVVTEPAFVAKVSGLAGVTVVATGAAPRGARRSRASPPPTARRCRRSPSTSPTTPWRCPTRRARRGSPRG